MSEFMHQPWGGEHRVYRKTVTFLGTVEEVNFCDACGTEVYEALVNWNPGLFVRVATMPTSGIPTTPIPDGGHEHHWGEWHLDDTGFHTRDCGCGTVEWNQGEIDAETRARGLMD